MKAYENENWSRALRLAIGRRIYTLTKMRAAALARGLADIATRCERLLAKERALMVRWKAYVTGQAHASAATWSSAILALDAQLDRLLTELRDLLEVQSRRPDTERGGSSKTIHDGHFKVGVTWYTHATMEDESARVKVLLDELDATAEEVAKAQVAEIVAEIAAVHRDYAMQIDTHQKLKQPDFEPLRAAELEAHRDLLGAYFHVLSATQDLPSDERLAVREALLSEAVAQNSEVSALVRARRRVTDVDPVSGAPLDAPEG